MDALRTMLVFALLALTATLSVVSGQLNPVDSDEYDQDLIRFFGKGPSPTPQEQPTYVSSNSAAQSPEDDASLFFVDPFVDHNALNPLSFIPKHLHQPGLLGAHRGTQQTEEAARPRRPPPVYRSFRFIEPQQPESREEPTTENYSDFYDFF